MPHSVPVAFLFQSVILHTGSAEPDGEKKIM